MIAGIAEMPGEEAQGVNTVAITAIQAQRKEPETLKSCLSLAGMAYDIVVYGDKEGEWCIG